MRADSHYVEQLDAPPQNQVIRLLPIDRIDVAEGSASDVAGEAPATFVASIQKHGILQPLLVQHRKGRYRVIAGRKRLVAAVAAGLQAVPCLVYHVDDDEARSLAEAANALEAVPSAPSLEPPVTPTLPGSAVELSKSLARTISYLGLLDPSALPQEVLTNLARAETSRAWCLGAASAAIASAEPGRTTVAVAQLVRRITDLCEPERRLRGVGLEWRMNVREATYVDVDADAIVAAVAGAVITTLEEVHGNTGATVTFVASVESRSRLVLSVVRSASTRPATTSFAVAMRDALDRIATSHGGRIVTSQQRQELTQSLELPLASAAM